MADLQTLPHYQGQGIRVFTLGQFRLFRQDSIYSSVGKKQPRRAFALLQTLIACGQVDKVSYNIEGILWPNAEPSAAKRSLTSTTRRLREILGEKQALVMLNGKLALNSSYVWSDAWAFDQGLSQGFADYQTLEDLLRLYQGKFGGEGEDLPIFEQARERLHQRYLDGVSVLGEFFEEQHKWQDAIDLYEQAIKLDDLSESLYQRLMHCYKQMGLTEQVADLYHRCESSLRTKLSISPSGKTRRLFEECVDN